MLGIIPECRRKLSEDKVVWAAELAPERSVHLGKSLILLSWIFLIHAAMLVIFFYFFLVLKLPLLVFVALLVFLLFVFAASYGRYSRSCGCRLAFGRRGWFFFDVLARRSRLNLSSAVIWPSLIMLYFNGPQSQARIVIITSDMVSAEEVRRLRVFLRTSL